MYPTDLRYTKEHEWIRVDDSVGVVGITNHAQQELGDIVFVDLPKVGDHVKAASPFGAVESVKAVSDIFSPVTGEVVAINDRLRDKPELLNVDPHGEAWLVQVRLSDPKEIETLMTAEQYQAYIQEAKAR